MAFTSEKQSSPAFENDANLPIAIVGGGLGGLALAIGLIKHGLRVQIYEAASAFSEIGAGVTFGINSTTALHLIDARLLEGYKKHATFNASKDSENIFYTMRWGTNGTEAGGHSSGDFICNLEDKWRTKRARDLGLKTRSCIHRARLLEELVALLPKNLTTFRKTFEGVEEVGEGVLSLRFADGTTALACAIIGCDGIKSKVRSLVCGDSVEATYAGECAYRAVVPKSDAEAILGSDLALNGNVYCGHGGYIITYPIEHGDFINMVAISHDIKRPWIWDHDDWTVPATKEAFLAHFKGWYPPLIETIARFIMPSKWALFDLQHDLPYYNGRLCLLGDSAHATTPHLGAGAGMAMEDAFILSSLIAACQNVGNIEDAFCAYDLVRRPRTQDCIKRSLQATLAYNLMIPEIDDDVQALIKLLEESFSWLWHEDLEAQLRTAKESLFASLDL